MADIDGEQSAMQGGMSYDNKSGVKYSEGGAVKGKTFRGSF